jgi:hypothetical protein
MKQAVFFSLLTLGLPVLAQTLPAPGYASRVNGSANLVTEQATQSAPVRMAPPVKQHPRSSHHHRKPVHRTYP